MRNTVAQSGFTLVELMIVVAIVGILGTLAYVGVRHYVGASKSAEARNSIGAIAKDAAAAFDRETPSTPVFAGQNSGASKQLCKAASVTVPTSFTDVRGRKYQSTLLDWAVDAPLGAGFACLGFEMDQPQYYMYSYLVSGTGTAVGDSFTAMAQGDLAGSGATSAFSITGAIGGALVVNVAPVIKESCTAPAGTDCPDQ
jgi:type IV pilus assembly protein PilA